LASSKKETQMEYADIKQAVEQAKTQHELGKINDKVE